MPAMLAVTLTTLALVSGTTAPERTILFPMLRNGDFELPQEPAVVPGGIPWWLQRDGDCQLVVDEGRTWLVTSGAAVASQPIPAYAPLAEDLVIRGTVQGVGRLRLVDGGGRAVEREVGWKGKTAQFELSGVLLAEQMGAAPVPRLELELSAAGDAPARWTDLELLVPLPCPDEEELRAEVVARLQDCIDPWLERGLDRFGSRETGLVGAFFDAVTGEVITTHAAGYHPLTGLLFDAVEFVPDPDWEAALDRWLADAAECLVQPDTGLPRRWHVFDDRPLDARFLEIHLDLEFWLDVAERGPEAWRARALAIAERMGAAVLARGVLPDGNLAPKYRPSDGASSNEARSIRRLDVPAQLVRLARLGGDERGLEVSRDAVANLLYTHYWPGSWYRIDPGFDDDFGHYAQRAGVMATCYPDEPLFRRVVDTGWERYRVLWPQALRFGGSMAADQVRGWKILIDYAELRPEIRPELDGLLEEAVHAHLRGQQYGNGAWGDVTYFGFQPAVDLQVGDLPGTPTNLLEGLADVYASGLGPEPEHTRALFTAVLRSSVDQYWRRYGFLSTVAEVDGPNHAGGSLRIGPALTRMLAALSGPR